MVIESIELETYLGKKLCLQQRTQLCVQKSSVRTCSGCFSARNCKLELKSFCFYFIFNANPFSDGKIATYFSYVQFCRIQTAFFPLFICLKCQSNSHSMCSIVKSQLKSNHTYLTPFFTFLLSCVSCK